MRKVSILCAAHNEAEHIGEMIASVLSQDYDSFELLIANDRSTDGTDTEIATWSAADARVKAVPSDGVHGKNSAWNRAFEYATGDIVVYLAADDTIPPGSLSQRVFRFPSSADLKRESIAVFSKLRMFSEDPRFDGVIVPRGQVGSRSGATTAMSRAMAERVFPLPTDLPNEDLWTSTLLELRCSQMLELPIVTLNYRIHSGNSMKRDQTFSDANDYIARRHEAFRKLLDASGFNWTVEEEAYLVERAKLEAFRRRGDAFSIAFNSRAPARMRLRTLAYSSPLAYAVRTRFYRLFSGWSKGF